MTAANKSNLSNKADHKHYLSKLVTIFKNIFDASPETKHPEEKDDTAKKMEIVENYEAKLLEDVFPKDEDRTISLIRDYHFRNLIFSISSYFRRVGYEDGKLGQKKIPIYEIAKSWAYSFRNHIQAYYEGLLSQLITNIKGKEADLENAKKEYSEDGEYLKLMTDRYRRNPRYFSKSLGILYLVCSILLVFADIPLALKLIQYGFNLDIGLYEKAIDNFINNPWGVFKANWEVFVLSFGVALCTIYVKILYDEFLASPLERAITQFRKLDGVKYPEDEQKLKRVHRIRIGFKLSVLLLTLSTIFVMGLFRFKTIEDMNRAEEKNQMQKESPIQVGENFYTKEQTPKKDDQPNRPQDSIESDGSRNWITQYTFIAITLLFPIIGGICLSLGLNNLENIRDFKKAKKINDQSKVRWLKASEELDEATRRKHNLENALKWCEKPDFVSHHLRYFISYYEHGYEKGLIEPLSPDTDMDLFDRADKLRNRMVSHSIYKSVREANSAASEFDFEKRFEKDFLQTDTQQIEKP